MHIGGHGLLRYTFSIVYNVSTSDQEIPCCLSTGNHDHLQDKARGKLLGSMSLTAFVIEASLSEPHTSVTSLCAVRVYV